MAVTAATEAATERTLWPGTSRSTAYAKASVSRQLTTLSTGIDADSRAER